MATASSASRWLSRSVKIPPQPLLHLAETSSASAARNQSTSPHSYLSAVSWHLKHRQLGSSRGPRPSNGLVLGSVTGEPFKKALRRFSVSPVTLHDDLIPPKPGEELHITFIDKEGDEHSFKVAKGNSLLDIAIEHDMDIEGACGGSCACSTCHVIVEEQEMYNRMIPEDDDENDMLDLAFGLTPTSRLGCQVKMSKDLDGLRVKLPAMTRNLQATDFSKKNERSD